MISESEIIYFGIGILIAVVVYILVIVAVFRYAFALSTRNNVDIDNYNVAPGLPLLGSEDFPWILTALLSLGGYFLGLQLVIIAWPLMIFVIIQVIISYSRKKNFS